MGNEIPLQLAQFFRSILLGGSLAMLYEVTRALNGSGGRIRELLLDALLSICAVSALFLFVMAEEGELRLFFLLGALGGAVLFFSLFGGAFRPIPAFWLSLMLFPLRLSDIFLKKLLYFFKKVFHFIRKWFTIMDTPNPLSNGEERAYGEKALQSENSSQQ